MVTALDSALAETIDPFVAGSVVFEPDAAHELAVAFDQICEVLKLPRNANNERETIAMRVIDLARNGVIDAHAIRDRVLSEAHTAL